MLLQQFKCLLNSFSAQWRTENANDVGLRRRLDGRLQLNTADATTTPCAWHGISFGMYRLSQLFGKDGTRNYKQLRQGILQVTSKPRLDDSYSLA